MIMGNPPLCYYIVDSINKYTNSYVNAKQQLEQINQNLTEKCYKEKATATKKANI